MLNFDAANFRDWMAAVGLLRLVTETTDSGKLVWRHELGRYRLSAHDVPDDLAERCAAWIDSNRGAWAFADYDNVTFDAATWRKEAMESEGVATMLWCALASDAVQHRSKPRLQASTLEYGHGGGHQHWLASMRAFINSATTTQLKRVLSGERDESMKGVVCRWDHRCERSHAYRGRAPATDKMTQDQTINALAAIGLTSCPSAPAQRGLLTPLIHDCNICWPIWLAPLRIADLDAVLCCGWHWPTMRARRWISGKLFCFSRGELCEPEEV